MQRLTVGAQAAYTLWLAGNSHIIFHGGKLFTDDQRFHAAKVLKEQAQVLANCGDLQDLVESLLAIDQLLAPLRSTS